MGTKRSLPPSGATGTSPEAHRVPTLVAPPTALADGTLLVPRSSHGRHHARLLNPASHIVGRAYGRHRLWRRAEGPWRSVTTAPGALTITPAGLDVTWDIPVSNDFSLVVLPDKRIRECSDDLGAGDRVELLPRVAVDDPVTGRILALLDQELAVEDASSTLFLERAVDLLCVQLLRAHSTCSALRAAAPRRGLAAWQVKRVASYVLDRLDENIGLRELAQVVGLSRFHFCTAFRLATGSSPHEWLRARRMDRARELLARPALPITEVALAVGYGTPSAFSATFRRRVGVTPSEYRRRHASGAPD